MKSCIFVLILFLLCVGISSVNAQVAPTVHVDTDGIKQTYVTSIDHAAGLESKDMDNDVTRIIKVF